MLELVFHIVMLAAFAAFGAAQAVYYAHMLQLNSYRPERYARWCRQHPGRLFGAARLFFPLATVVASVVLAALELSAGWLYAAAAVCAGLGIAAVWPKKAKKPLVVTARVKRLFTTLVVLYGLFSLGMWFVPPVAAAIAYAVAALLWWLWVPVANWLNTPAEKMVANWYVNDARKKLADMPQLTVIGITGR